MAQVTIQVPDAQVQRVIDAFKKAYSYDPSPGGAHEGMTEPQFLKSILVNFVKDVVRSQEAQDAAVAARNAAMDSVNTEVTPS